MENGDTQSLDNKLIAEVPKEISIKYVIKNILIKEDLCKENKTDYGKSLGLVYIIV